MSDVKDNIDWSARIFTGLFFGALVLGFICLWTGLNPVLLLPDRIKGLSGIALGEKYDREQGTRFRTFSEPQVALDAVSGIVYEIRISANKKTATCPEGENMWVIAKLIEEKYGIDRIEDKFDDGTLRSLFYDSHSGRWIDMWEDEAKLYVRTHDQRAKERAEKSGKEAASKMVKQLHQQELDSL